MKADEAAALLPAVFRRALPRDDVLNAALDVMELLHAPVETLLEHIDVMFDPYRTPDRFVLELARWVDLDRIQIQDDIETGRLRELVARSFKISQLRGTATGLAMFLEIATGARGYVIEEPLGDGDAAFHLRVHVPAAAAGKLPLIERIINSEKPAYTTFETIVATS